MRLVSFLTNQSTSQGSRGRRGGIPGRSSVLPGESVNALRVDGASSIPITHKDRDRNPKGAPRWRKGAVPSASTRRAVSHDTRREQRPLIEKVRNDAHQDHRFLRMRPIAKATAQSVPVRRPQPSTINAGPSSPSQSRLRQLAIPAAMPMTLISKISPAASDVVEQQRRAMCLRYQAPSATATTEQAAPLS